MRLSSVAIKARNAHSLCIGLIEQGWIPAKPDFDEGVDLMAWHEKRGKTRAIQLKGRLTVAKQYVGRAAVFVLAPEVTTPGSPSSRCRSLSERLRDSDGH
ncbi:hypothetical protein ACFL6C_12355 [Myxococcota bacterium]